jgi:hypothetical protein
VSFLSESFQTTDWNSNDCLRQKQATIKKPSDFLTLRFSCHRRVRRAAVPHLSPVAILMRDEKWLETNQLGLTVAVLGREDLRGDLALV